MEEQAVAKTLRRYIPVSHEPELLAITVIIEAKRIKAQAATSSSDCT